MRMHGVACFCAVDCLDKGWKIMYNEAKQMVKT